MKQKKAWVLQKIQVQGIADDATYAAETRILFAQTAPWVPVFEQHEGSDTALSLIRHEEAWWIINYSDEWCCAVNDQIVAPHRRMRLNDGDIIEWGLSSWRLTRAGEVPHPRIPEPLPAQPPESVAEYLDPGWLKQQSINPQDPFDIIPGHGAARPYANQEADNPLRQLYQEYQQALLSPEQENVCRTESSPPAEDAAVQDLTSLYDQKTENHTLQDMVAGTPGIDAILDTLDAANGQEIAWLATEPLPDILQLFSPAQVRKTTHDDVLPDLTRREHRIIGIDSHYRITPARKK